MRWPLRTRLILAFGGVIVVAVGVMTAIQAGLAAQTATQQIEQRLLAVARFVENARFPLTPAVLKQVKELSGAELVAIDATGHVASTVTDTTDDRHASPPVVSPATNGLDEARWGDERYLAIVARRPSAEHRQLVVLYPRARLAAESRRAAVPSLVAGGVVLMIAVVVAQTLAHQVTRPVQQLQRQVDQLALGNFEEVPLPPVDDEIRRLARSVNVLVAELLVREQTIHRSERLALIGQLSGGLAHQLRNALAGIRLAIQIHQRSCGADAESLLVAERQVRLTEEQLQRLLAAGRPMQPELQPCELQPLIDGVVSLVAPTAQHRNVKLRVAAVNPATAVAVLDKQHFQQTLINLLMNAIEAVPAAGWVALTADCSPRDLVVRVSDSGPGPPPEIQPRLFEPFVTGKAEGIGLGLAVAQQFAKASGGSLRLAPGRPTVFELCLPLEGVAPASDSAVPVSGVHGS